MSINTITHASKYTEALDKKIMQHSVTGFLADNTFAAKFVGAHTVIMPDVDFVGLGDYNRESGYSIGSTTVAQSPYELKQDRGRKLVIDREDMDETGIANLAGQVLGEFVRTKVVPEVDAYVLSKLCGLARQQAHIKNYAADSAVADLLATAVAVHNEAGFDEELVSFVDSVMYSALMNSKEIERQIVVSDFKQGDLNFKVKRLNGMAIIPVSDARMKSAYVFNSGSNSDEGGFSPAEGAKGIRSIVMPKRAASLVKKSETLRIFTPEQNKDRDAYEFNYRLYYDVFVKKSNLDTIHAIVEA